MRDTIELAREAGFNVKMFKPPVITAQHSNGSWVSVGDELKAFEALVRADQREIDAKVCDDGYDTFFENNGVEHSRKRYDQQAVERAIRAGVEFVTADCAAAIRARGNT